MDAGTFLCYLVPVFCNNSALKLWNKMVGFFCFVLVLFCFVFFSVWSLRGLCFIIFIPPQAAVYSSVEALIFSSLEDGSAFTKAKLQHVEVYVTPLPPQPRREVPAAGCFWLSLPVPQNLTGRRRAGCWACKSVHVDTSPRKSATFSALAGSVEW